MKSPWWFCCHVLVNLNVIKCISQFLLKSFHLSVQWLLLFGWWKHVNSPTWWNIFPVGWLVTRLETTKWQKRLRDKWSRASLHLPCYSAVLRLSYNSSMEWNRSRAAVQQTLSVCEASYVLKCRQMKSDIKSTITHEKEHRDSHWLDDCVS